MQNGLERSLLGSVATVLLGGGVAVAQEDPAPSGGRLETIVVTAQKRSENIQDVPIVVTTISAEQLADSGITGLEQTSILTPGLTMRQSSGSLQPTIRGIGTSSGSSENPVALYIDDVYLPIQREGLRELPDVEQISVLKGPQGTLFGRNATGGVIQVTTRKPTQELVLQGELGIDDYETIRTSAYISGGLAEDLAASLSVQYSDQGEGYGTNLVTGNGTYQLLHSHMVRGKFVYDAGPNTEITLIGDYMDRAAHTHDLHEAPGTSFVVPVGPLETPRDIYSQIDPRLDFEAGGVSLAIDHEFSFASLKTISAYRKAKAANLFDVFPVGVPLVYVESPDSPSHSFTQEVQLVSTNPSAVSWTAGAFYFHLSHANLPITRIFHPALFGGSPPPTFGFRQSTFGKEIVESIAPFAQLDIDIFPSTTLTLGARYTFEERRATGEFVNELFNGTFASMPSVSQSIDAEEPTWRAALNHNFTDDIVGYVSYNRGFKSGGFNIGNPQQAGYLPELLDAYEAGVKTELFDGRLRLNVGGFYYDYTNLQVTQFVSGTTSVVNGAKAEIYGVDVDFEASLSDELRLRGGFEVLDATFKSYPNAIGTVPNPAGGLALTVIDASGNRLPGSQEFAGTIALDYERDVSFGSMNFNVTANYNGDYFLESDNFVEQDSYVWINTSLRWTSKDGHYGLSIWGRNLADELITTGAAALTLGHLVAYERPPRTYGVTAHVNF